MDEDDPCPQYDKPKQKPIFRRDRHLASALTNGEIQYLFNNWKNPPGLKREHRLLIKETKDTLLLPSDQFVHWALLHISGCNDAARFNRELQRHLRVASDTTYLGHVNYTRIEPTLAPPLAPSLIRKTYTQKRLLGEIVERITFNKHFRQEYIFFGCKAVCFGNLHVIWTSDRFAYIVTHSHFLAVRDSINAWFSCLLYSYQNNRKYPGYSLYNEVANIITAVLHDMGMYKDQVYTILKSWQPLVIGTILKYMEANPEFLNSLQEVIADHPSSFLIGLATRPLTNTIDCHLALELTGMTKCFGHPEIVMDSSIAAWVEKGTVRKEGLEDVGEMARRAFVLEFSRNYFKQRRRWPNLILTDDTDPRVRECYQNGYWGETPKEPWTLEMFANVKFDKTLAFDFQVYTADLLADKSIIPGLSHWPHEYDRQAHRTNHGFFPQAPERKSSNVIINYLQQEEVNVKAIIDIISTGVIPGDWRVCIGVAKEREMKKLKARFFGKLCPEMRLYQVSTENNIKNVFKYIPHQTMTKSEDSLMKHLIKMSESSEHDEGGYVFISIDFSSWCTSFRYEGVTPLLEEMDRLLGVTNVMAFTQMFPLMSYLMFQDRFNPPRQGPDGLPLNGPRCIIGPEAWMEGLRQKGWTLLTIMLILIASWECSTVATLTGQGDNQVIYLRIPGVRVLKDLGMTKSQYIMWFQRTLRDLCDRAGITMKLEETWTSGILLEYGREFFLKGAQVSSSLKRISRIASEANQTIPSINGDLAGIFSSGMAAAQKDHQPVAAYWTAIVEASISLHERYPTLWSRSKEYIACLLSVSRILGGFPITLFANFCTRSVQDPLTCQLSLAKTILQSPRHREEFLTIATTSMKHADPKMLIQDPQSLPLSMPRQPENYIKDKIAEGLPSLIKNKEILPLFTPDMESGKTALIYDLMRIRPCNPKVLSKLMALSNAGKQDALIRKFSNTRSIQAIACREWNTEEDILRHIRSLEENTMEHILARGRDRVLAELHPQTCTTHLAQQLRELGWGLQIEGVTMAAQQEQCYLTCWESVPVEDYSKVIALTMRGDTSLDWTLARGPVTPYIGAPTKVRAKRQPLQETETYSFNQALIQALQLRSWVKGDRGMMDLLDALIKEKTDASTEELDRRTAHVYSGSLTHRLPCPTMNRGGQSNTTSNLASHIQINSSTATDYAKKGEDYTICFQSVFLYGLVNLSLIYHQCKTLPSQMAIVLHSGCCIWDIPPETFSLSGVTYPGVPIPTARAILPETDDKALISGATPLGALTSYAAHMAYKFATWILNRRDTSVISALERRAVEESTTPPFVNLSEMSKIDLESFLNYLMTYLALLDYTMIGDISVILNDARKTQTRTGFDDLIDSIILSGLTGRFCKLTASSVLDLQDMTGWRLILCDTLEKATRDSWLTHVLRSFAIIPEDETFLLRRWIGALAYIMQEYILVDTSTPRGVGRALDRLEGLLNKRGLDLPLIKIARSEEESVATVRRSTRYVPPILAKILHPTRPLPNIVTHTPVPKERVELTMCLDGGLMINQLYELSPHLEIYMQLHVKKKVYLVTIDDLEGRAYSNLQHCTPSRWSQGFPIWTPSEKEMSLILEVGPKAVTGDACLIPYSHTEFLANIGTTGWVRLMDDASREEMLIVIPSTDKVLAFAANPDPTLLLVRNWPIPPSSSWFRATAVVFQPVEGEGQSTWYLYRRDKEQCLGDICLGLGIGEYRSILRRPIEIAMFMQTTRISCLSPMSSAAHLLGGYPIDRKDLLARINRRVEIALRRLPLEGGGWGPARDEMAAAREREIRKEVVDVLAVLGLLKALMRLDETQEPRREHSYFKVHFHRSPHGGRDICQGRCTKEKKSPSYTRSYRQERMGRWWKSCILLVAATGGAATADASPPCARLWCIPT